MTLCQWCAGPAHSSNCDRQALKQMITTLRQTLRAGGAVAAAAANGDPPPTTGDVALKLQVGFSDGQVVVGLGRAVEWFILPPAIARDLAAQLNKQADALDGGGPRIIAP